MTNGPIVEVTADRATGDPGDTITWSVRDPGHTITQVTLKMDGILVDWSSPHTWTAIASTHLFFVEVRWGDQDQKETYI